MFIFKTLFPQKLPVGLKPGHQTTENMHVIWSDELSFTVFPTSGRDYVRRTPKEAYNPK
jgi:hypothetical protein